MKIVPKATNADDDDDSAEPETDHLPAEMEHPVQRQTVMRNAVTAGQIKISKSASHE